MWKKILASCLLVISFTAPVMASDEALTLDWIDLVPEAERKMFDSVGMPASDHSGGAAQQSKIGNVRSELNGSEVKIPGFVIPLEGDANTVTEFLLVPYFGACIHVPPPPPNQIIYVVGTLKTETISHELAETGYVIEGTAIEAYDDM